MISVVIPCYNGASRIGAALESVLRARALTPEPVEVIVVDNGSWDGTSAVVASSFETVRRHRVAPNRGFSGGVMAGAELATGRIIAVLSDDLVLECPFFAPLVAHFERPDTFAVMPRVLSWRGDSVEVPPVVPSVNRGRLSLRLIGEDRVGRASESGRRLPTFHVMGGMALFHRERFLALGGFSPLFAPFNHEDIDLCWRAWSRGWGSYYEPQSAVRHCHERGAVATQYREAVREATGLRNALLVNVMNLDQSVLRQILHFARRALRRIVSPRKALPFWLALPAILRRLPAALQKRRVEMSSRAFDNQKTFALITSAWSELESVGLERLAHGTERDAELA